MKTTPFKTKRLKEIETSIAHIKATRKDRMDQEITAVGTIMNSDLATQNEVIATAKLESEKDAL